MIYEIDGKETKTIPNEFIVFESHWNRSEMVNIIIDGKKITVSAADLKAAIDNATNSNRYH
jgi:hypothetical protein